MKTKTVDTNQNQTVQNPGIEVSDLNKPENNQPTNQPETKSVGEEVNDTVINLLGNRQSAEITVDEIMKALGDKYSRTDVLDVLRRTKIGHFCVGRKSRASRLQIGPAIEQKPIKTQTVKRAYHNRNITPVTRKMNSSERVIRVNIGGAVLNIPLKLALVEEEIAA